MRRITATQKTMILAASRRNGPYRPTSRQGFQEMQTLVGLGIFEEAEDVQGSYRLTTDGEKDASFLEELEKATKH